MGGTFCFRPQYMLTCKIFHCQKVGNYENFFVLLYFDFDFLIPFYNNLVWFKAVLLRTRICPRK